MHYLNMSFHIILHSVSGFLKLKYFIQSSNCFACPHMNETRSHQSLLAGLAQCNAYLAVRAGCSMMWMFTQLSEHSGA